MNRASGMEGKGSAFFYFPPYLKTLPPEMNPPYSPICAEIRGGCVSNFKMSKGVLLVCTVHWYVGTMTA